MAFPLERQAQELDARLRELSDALRGGAARVAGVTKGLLDPGFRGARLLPIDGAAHESGAARCEEGEGSAARADARRSRVWRGTAAADRRCPRRRRRGVPHHLHRTGRRGDSPSGLRTTVRYDIVGAGTKAYRVEHVGEWEMGWRRNASGWQVVRWTATSHLVSRARQPDLHRDHRGGARWQRLVPPPAQHRSRLVDGDVRLGPDARLERPSGRLGRRCGRRWTRRSVRRPAGRIAQSPLPQSRRLDLRGHHGPGGRRRPRRHGAVALCRRRQRRRSGSRRGDLDQAAAVHQRRQGAFHARFRTPSGSRGRFRAC